MLSIEYRTFSPLLEIGVRRALGLGPYDPQRAAVLTFLLACAEPFGDISERTELAFDLGAKAQAP